jgi:hypothetical protein
MSKPDYWRWPLDKYREFVERSEPSAETEAITKLEGAGIILVDVICCGVESRELFLKGSKKYFIIRVDNVKGTIGEYEAEREAFERDRQKARY